MKNICIFDTAVGSLNLGDEIIYASALEGLKPILYDASLYRLGTHVANFTSLQMMRPGVKIKFLSESMDFRFICGTSLIVPSFKRVQKQFMLAGYLAPLYKGAVLIGAGKSKAYERIEPGAAKLYKKILSEKYKHSVRDDAAKEVIESLGLKALNTGCPTLWGFTKERCEKIPKKKAENVIFSVSGQPKYRDPDADKFMIECLMNNYSNVYAWVQTSRDEPYLRTLIDPEERGVTVIRSLWRYADLLRGGNIDYVGTRLHGGIFAMQLGARSLIVSIDHRAEGIHSSNNIPIIRRSDIHGLGDIINSDIITDIRTDRQAIEEFVGQFSD